MTAAAPHREECTMKHTKKITILHSNDLHGDFLAEQVDENGFISEVSEKQPQPPEIQIHLPHIHEPREQTEVHPLYK